MRLCMSASELRACPDSDASVSKDAVDIRRQPLAREAVLLKVCSVHFIVCCLHTLEIAMRSFFEVGIDRNGGAYGGRLMQEPVCALRSRCEELLEEWPENPILVRIVTICDRLLEFPLAAPLMQVRFPTFS
jgi:hypothetical protein